VSGRRSSEEGLRPVARALQGRFNQLEPHLGEPPAIEVERLRQERRRTDPKPVAADADGKTLREAEYRHGSVLSLRFFGRKSQYALSRRSDQEG